jgi:hypothetical protein
MLSNNMYIYICLPVSMAVYDTRKIFSFRKYNRHVVTALQFLTLAIYDLKKKYSTFSMTKSW